MKRGLFFLLACLLFFSAAYAFANDPAQAVPLYRQAVTNDPSLAPASFYLARSLILTGHLREALSAVEQGLEFSPHDTTGLAMRRDLERALGGR